MKKQDKPTKAILVDHLIGDQDIIKEKNDRFNAYNSKIFNDVAREAGTKDLFDIIIYLAEKYHDTHRLGEKVGRKNKWTPKLQVMLAVYIDNRKKGVLILEEIMDMMRDRPWKFLVQKFNNKKVEGDTSIEYHRKKGLKNPDYEWMNKLYKSDLTEFMKQLASEIKR